MFDDKVYRVFKTANQLNVACYIELGSFSTLYQHETTFCFYFHRINEVDMIPLIEC